MGVQKSVNLEDLEKCCKMSIWLQKSASIQPRTSLSKFAKNWPKVRLKVRLNIAVALPEKCSAHERFICRRTFQIFSVTPYVRQIGTLLAYIFVAFLFFSFW